MDVPFPYEKPVSGRDLIGRAAETGALVNLLSAGRHAVIYEPPKTGKTSVVQQALRDLKGTGLPFEPVQLSLLAVRTLSDLTRLLTGAMERGAGGTLFPGGETGMEDLRAAFLLPYRIGQQTGVRRVVVLEEFQNILLTEDGDGACRVIEEMFRTLPPGLADCASYVFVGSRVNAMHEIFGVRRRFWRQVEHIRLGPVDGAEIAEHVVRGFLTSGKVIERERVQDICTLFRNHLWYINHFCSVCDTLTRGYIVEQTLRGALDRLVAVHEPRFTATMDDLTAFQAGLLRAILDGRKRLSSAEVIRRYDLHSPANVRRLRDALCKKEIVCFDADDNPSLQDPLFEHWVRKRYFNLPAE